MIAAAILYTIWAAIWAITLPLRAFDDVTLPASITDAIATANGYLSSLDYILPINTLIAMFSLMILIEGFILTWRGINWLLRRLPTQS